LNDKYTEYFPKNKIEVFVNQSFIIITEHEAVIEPPVPPPVIIIKDFRQTTSHQKNLSTPHTKNQQTFYDFYGRIFCAHSGMSAQYCFTKTPLERRKRSCQACGPFQP
ncbi:MAG: hypothetical protein K2H68_05900, partial [Bacteroidales bacterium]|nr:hypothetical protein [Bacteroidales bacterium]